MTSEKKFLCPKLYPIQQNMNATWFIKYRVRDYNTGTMVSRKYYGLLNREPDKVKRLALAKEYLAMIERGDELPDYQGMKNLPAPGYQTGFATASGCIKKFLAAHDYEIMKRTASQYRSRAGIFEKWLFDQGKHQCAIGALDKELCREFLFYLKNDRGLSNKTFNDYKSLFITIWDEYLNDGKIKVNPWKQIKSLPNNTRHLSSFPEELRQLIRDTMPEYDPQLWLFMQCVYYCAIRPHSELRRMKVKHLSISAGLFLVPAEISKTKKRRTVNIYTDLLRQLRESKYDQHHTDFYLFSKNNEPGPELLGINFFKKRWNQYKAAHNISSEYKLYGMKHTGGKALSKQFNQYITQEHFGHSSPNSTQQYINDLGANELHFLQKEFPEF